MKKIHVALVGNQNCGKSSLFNILTRSNQKIGNFPGVTIEKKEGSFYLEKRIKVIDLPGTYSMFPYSEEEKITRDYLFQNKPDIIVNILDGTILQRGLYLTLQLLSLNIPMIVVINMMDEVEEIGMKIDISSLSSMLHVPVYGISAKKEEGIEAFFIQLKESSVSLIKPQSVFMSYDIENIYHKIHTLLQYRSINNFDKEQLYLDTEAFLCSHVTDETVKKQCIGLLNSIEYKTNMDSMASFIYERYQIIEKIISKTVTYSGQKRNYERSYQIDYFLTHPTWAIPFFFFLMGIIFFLTFNLFGKAGQQLLEQIFQYIEEVLLLKLQQVEVSKWMIGLVIDGIYHGVTGVLSFIPIILILFFFLSILEDSGYMARVAYVMDGLLKPLGLSGKSFVPMMIGFGCSVPAILSTRTMTDKKQKILTMMFIPFISCPAKLPIYSCIIACFFPTYSISIILILYSIGLLCAVISTFILHLLDADCQQTSFLLELPPYRMPSLKNMVKQIKEKANDFITKAFTIILLSSIVIWFCSNITISLEYTTDSYNSILAVLSRKITFLFQPIGLGDWRIIASLLSGFTAKETVISSLSILLKTQQNNLFTELPALFTKRTAFIFLIFVLLYPPCFATLSVIKNETKSWMKTLFVCIYQSLVAYFVSLFFSLFLSFCI